MTSKQSNQIENDTTKIKIEECFIDSLNLGIKGKYKIIVKQIRFFKDGVYVMIDLFENSKGHWIKAQSYKIEKDGITSLDLVISDFNNDGLKDMTVQTSIAARGSNEIKSLFLFDKSTASLKLVKNSSDYPNLQYNKELDCIDSWQIYGGSTTLFLILEADTLREFAGVDLFDSLLTIYQIDKKGKKTVLEQKKRSDLFEYTRFKNYHPLRINEENQ